MWLIVTENHLQEDDVKVLKLNELTKGFGNKGVDEHVKKSVFGLTSNDIGPKQNVLVYNAGNSDGKSFFIQVT